MDFVAVYVPSVFVVKPKQSSDAILPPPGRLTLEDLQPPPDANLPFLRARKSSAPSSSSSPARAAVVREVGVSGDALLPLWDVDEAQLAQHEKAFDVAATIRAVFQDAASRDDDGVAGAVFRSLRSPFQLRNNTNRSTSSDDIVWRIARRAVPIVEPSAQRLGGRKLANRHRAHLQGVPWSIVPFTDGVEVRKNMILGGDGVAVAQIDFAHGGSSSCGTHAHALVRNNLEHAAVHQDDHLFPLTMVPWFWCAVRHEVVAGGGGGGLRLADTTAVDHGCSWVAGRLASEPLSEFDDEDARLDVVCEQ